MTKWRQAHGGSASGAREHSSRGPNSENQPELDLALHTGLRRSEMYGLDWRYVDLGRRFLQIRRGKNGDPRYVRLNVVAIKALGVLQKAGESAPVIKSRAGEALLARAIGSRKR
jgi:integrase